MLVLTRRGSAREPHALPRANALDPRAASPAVRVSLQHVAAGACVAMIVLLTYVQFLGSDSPPPLPLYLVFVGVWTFGAVMLMTFPRFGAVGTALYGVLLAVQVLRMHGGSALNFVIAIGSLAATGLALMYLMMLRRAGSGAA